MMAALCGAQLTMTLTRNSTSGMLSCVRFYYSNRTGITKIHRLLYKRMYPTTLVLQDGSSIVIRYHEPRQIIKLPLDLSTLSPEMQKLRLLRRKTSGTSTVEDTIKDTFDAQKYLSFVSKKK